MRLQEERAIPPFTPTGHLAGQPTREKPGYGPTITSNAPFQPPHTVIPVSRSVVATTIDHRDEERPGMLQDTQIRGILRSMSLGHLVLGVILALGGVILEVVFHEAAFFGLAASGGMLGACGLITLLAPNRQRGSQSPLAFYLLPYADFAIVGLWLLLFSVSGPIVLFYAYVIVSAALLLGSRHAIALTGIAIATILAITLGQYQAQLLPAALLPYGMQVALTMLSTTLALGLIVYVALLFSLNLDRFITISNRQREDLIFARRHIEQQEEQIQDEVEHLNATYGRFIAGDTDARASVPGGSLALAAQILNALLEQIESLSHDAAARARMEERIGELTLAVDRLSNGDVAALQFMNGASGTSLDTLTVALARVGRQLLLLQQTVQQAAGNYTAIMGIVSGLSLLRQTLISTDNPLRDLQTRSAQNAVHLHALLESEGGYNENRSTERPFLREMELRARQQSGGLEMLRARLGQIGSQMESIETELRRYAESIEQIIRGPRSTRSGQAGASPVDLATSGAPRRPPSGTLRAVDALPQRFISPLKPAELMPPEGPAL